MKRRIQKSQTVLIACVAIALAGCATMTPRYDDPVMPVKGHTFQQEIVWTSCSAFWRTWASKVAHETWGY